MSIRRAPLRAASAGLAVASVLLLATCDLDSLKPNDGTVPGNPFDSTELSLGLLGTTTVGTAVTMPLGGTATMSVTSASVSLANVVKRYSATGGFIIVDSLTGDMHTSGTIGTSRVTARILAPELGDGVTISRDVRVRYTGIAVTSPLVSDTIKGLGPAQNRTATLFGKNLAGANVASISLIDSVRSRDTTVIRVSGTTVSGRRTGTTYMVAFHDGFRDSVLVRVRQVAKNITFPTTDYTARHMNFGLTVPIATVTDITDSLIPVASRVMKWRTKDATAATVDSLTGVLLVKKVTGDTIFAKMDTVERKQRIVVSQEPSLLTKAQGDARSDTVAKNVTVVPTVAVLDSGSTAIVGASVRFRIGTGLNASVNDTLPVLSDSLGRAKPTSWKIGTVAGTNNNTLIATAGTQTATFTVSAIAGRPKKLAFVVQPTSVTARASIAPAIQVQIQDSLGNPILTATDSVVLSLSTNPGAATLGGTLRIAAVAGVATFSTVTLSATGSGYQLQASSGALTVATSNGFNVLAQAIASLSKFQGDARSDTVAKNVSVVPTVTVLDSIARPITGASVRFRIGTGLNASVNDTLPVLTDTLGRAKPTSWKIGTVAGTNNNTLIATAGTQTATFTVSAIAGAPRRLAFIVQPTSATALTSIAPAIQVQIQDSLGNPILTATDSVVLSLSNNPGGATLGGTFRVAAVAGTATFSTVTLSTIGSGYALQAASAALQVAISNGFDVVGPKNKLAFSTQPATGSEGGVLPTFRVQIQDASSNRIASATDSVMLTIGTNPGTGLLSGTTKVAAVAGVATFSNVIISRSGIGYTLVAAAPTLPNPNATSGAFNVTTVGTASKLTFISQPSNVVSGVAIAPSFAVQVQDIYGALVTSSPAQITLSIDPTTNPTGLATLSGITTVAASAGVATFSNVIVNRAGTGYKLIAAVTSSAITTATSSTFSVTAGTATKLAFFQGPTHTTVSQTMSPAVVVEIQDANGNRVTSGAIVVTLTLNNCTGTFTGGGAATSAVGIATYSGLSVGTTGTSCSLSATATPAGLVGLSSNSFNIVAVGGAVRLKFTTQPQSSTAGVALNAGTVAIQDANGVTVGTASASVAISVASGPSTSFFGSSGLTAAPSATFSSNTFQIAGTYQLVATASGYRPDTSTAFVIAPAVASRFVFVVQPSNIVAGMPFAPTLQAAVQDQYGNPVTSAINTITAFAYRTDGSQAVFFNTGTTAASATAVSGIATFTGLSVRTAGTGYSICTVGVTGLQGTCATKTFDVVAAPIAALAFVQQPATVTSGAAFSSTVSVQGQDSVGNKLTDFTSPVTLALTGGTAGAVLSGTKTVSAVAGVATFPGLTIDKSGTGYRLNASASGLTTALSGTFTVNVGAASKLVWSVQPAATTFLNAPLGAAGDTARVEIQDAQGNTVTSDFRQVDFTVSAGPSTTFKMFGSSVTTGFANAMNGVVKLPTSTLDMSTVGTGYRMSANASGLTSGVSTAFAVNAFDVKDKLGWNNEPQNGSYRVSVSGPSSTTPNVFVRDRYDNLVTSATDSVTVSILVDANPTTILVGGGKVASAGGTASFPSMLLNKAGTGFKLLAAATGLKSDTSAAFNITSPGQVAPCCVGVHYARVGNTIYFTGNNAVKAVSVFGGTVTSVIGSTNAAQITTDGTNVYWSERGSNNNGDAFIKKYTVATNTVSTLTTGQVSLNPWGDVERIFSDGTNVYFAARNAATTAYAIKSISVNAVSGSPVEVVSVSSQPYFLLAGGQIFYKDPSTQVIKRMTTAGATQTTLTTGSVGADRFALIGTTLFWNDGVNIKSIANAPSASAAVAPTTVVTAPGTVYEVTTDGTSLFVNFAGSVRRYATSDFSTFTELSSASSSWYYSIIFDAIDVFFYRNDGTISKVPK